MNHTGQAGGEDDGAAGKALHSRTRLEHCLLTGVGVRYWSAGKSKWKSRIIRFLRAKLAPLRA
jgi:hypothetical protein